MTDKAPEFFRTKVADINYGEGAAEDGFLKIDNYFYEREAFPTAFEAYALADAKIAEIVSRPAPVFPDPSAPVHMVQVPFGVGKTRATEIAVVQGVLERGDDPRKVLWCSMTHELLAEVREDMLGAEIMAEAEKRIKAAVPAGKEVRVAQYFSQRADCKLDGENTPCRRLDEVMELLRVGGDGASLCGTKGGGYCPHSRLHDNHVKHGKPCCDRHQSLADLDGADVILGAGQGPIYDQVPGPVMKAARKAAFWTPIEGKPHWDWRNVECLSGKARAAKKKEIEEARKEYFAVNGEPNPFRLLVVDEFAPEGALDLYEGRLAADFSSLMVDPLESAITITEDPTLPAELSDAAIEAGRKHHVLRQNLTRAYGLLAPADEKRDVRVSPDEVEAIDWVTPFRSTAPLSCLMDTKSWLKRLRLNVEPIPAGIKGKAREGINDKLRRHLAVLRDCENILSTLIDILRDHAAGIAAAAEMGLDGPSGDQRYENLLINRETRMSAKVMLRRSESDAIRNTPVLMLNATADHDLNRQVLSNYTVAHQGVVEPNEFVDHYHILDESFSHAQLTGEENVESLVKDAQRQIILLLWWAHNTRGGITLLIIPKAFADFLRKNPDLVPPILEDPRSKAEADAAHGVLIYHYGNTRGRNGGKHCRTHLQFGRPQPTRDEVERMTSVLFGTPKNDYQHPDHEKDVIQGRAEHADCKWEYKDHRYWMKDGSWYLGSVPWHPDERVMQVYRSVTLAEYEQALGRSRANQRTADSRLLIITAGNVPLQDPITRPISPEEPKAMVDPRFVSLMFKLWLSGKWAAGFTTLFGEHDGADVLEDDNEFVIEDDSDRRDDLPHVGLEALTERPRLCQLMAGGAEDPADAYRKRKKHNSALPHLERIMQSVDYGSHLTLADMQHDLSQVPAFAAMMNLNTEESYSPAIMKATGTTVGTTVYGIGTKKQVMARLREEMPCLDVKNSRLTAKKTAAEHEAEVAAALAALEQAEGKLAEVKRGIRVEGNVIWVGGLNLATWQCVGHAQEYLRTELNRPYFNGVRATWIEPKLTNDTTTFPDAMKAVSDAQSHLQEVRSA